MASVRRAGGGYEGRLSCLCRILRGPPWGPRPEPLTCGDYEAAQRAGRRIGLLDGRTVRL